MDLIKLDLAFLHSFEVNPHVSVIISHVVHMAKIMGIHTLCEGVETRAEYNFLKEIGCEKSQGFYFCRPVPVERLCEYQGAGYLGTMEAVDMSDYYDDVGMVFLSEIYLLQQQNRTAGEAGGLIIGRFFCRKYKKKIRR